MKREIMAKLIKIHTCWGYEVLTESQYDKLVQGADDTFTFISEWEIEE